MDIYFHFPWSKLVTCSLNIICVSVEEAIEKNNITLSSTNSRLLRNKILLTAYFGLIFCLSFKHEKKNISFVNILRLVWGILRKKQKEKWRRWWCLHIDWFFFYYRILIAFLEEVHLSLIRAFRWWHLILFHYGLCMLKRRRKIKSFE